MKENIAEMLAREAEEAEEVADAEERGERAPAQGQRARRQASDPSQVYTVRIPSARLKELRRVAERLGEAPSALLRRWALERLDAELGHGVAGKDPATGAVLVLTREEFETSLARVVQAVVGRHLSLPGEAASADDPYGGRRLRPVPLDQRVPARGIRRGG
jgi:hypothetical protein